MSEMLYVLSTDAALFTASSVAGFCWSYGTFKNLLEYPLSSSLNGAMGSFFACLGTGIVDTFMPPLMRPVLVLVLSASGAYYVYRSL